MKCPICASSILRENKTSMRCEKCGYEHNKTTGEIINKIKKEKNAELK